MLAKVIKAGAKIIANGLAESAGTSAGTKIGEAIGARIAAKIYTPPPSDDEKGGDK